MRLLLDTNVLLLLIVGSLKPEAIGGKRLTEFDEIDFELVFNLASQVPLHISTPHILAETSNFLGSGLQQLVKGGTDAFARNVAKLDEIYVPAKDVVATPEFHSLGLTDAAIPHLAGAGIRIVSVDFHLCNRLSAKGVDAINPRNLRAL